MKLLYYSFSTLISNVNFNKSGIFNVITFLFKIKEDQLPPTFEKRKSQKQKLFLYFTKKRLKRLKRVKDIIRQEGCQMSARIKMLKNSRFTQNLYLFTTYFFNIADKSIISFLKVVSSSSKNTKNPPLVYIKYNVKNKYAAFLFFPFLSFNFFLLFQNWGKYSHNFYFWRF